MTPCPYFQLFRSPLFRRTKKLLLLRMWAWRFAGSRSTRQSKQCYRAGGVFAAHVSCRQVVESQSKKVFHSEAFYEMSKDTLCRVLRVDRLSVHEIDVFRACLHWAERRASLLNLALTPANKRQVGPAPCDFVTRSY